MKTIVKLIPWALALFINGVFLDSLRFKFTGSPTTEHIFTTLKEWSGVGLFHPAGPWIVGGAELVASLLLLIVPVILVLIGLKRTAHGVQWLGALVALGVMSGAIIFHLFTPLGIEVPLPDSFDDPGGPTFSPALFYTACATWASAAILLVWRRDSIPAWVPVLGRKPALGDPTA